MGFMPDEGMQGLAETSQIQSGNGSWFTWVNYKEMQSAKAFGEVGNYFVMISLEKIHNESAEQKLEKKQALLQASLDKKVQKETGLESYTALFEKYCSGLEKAGKKEPENMEKAMRGDKELYRKLLKKYSHITDIERDCYEACEKRLSNLSKQPEKALDVTQEDMKRFLNKMDFTVL